MDREIYTVIALPHSFRDDDDVHVSLFVAPRLTPTRDGEPLSESRVFSSWTAQLRDARIELFDDQGQVDCTPALDVLEPALWTKLFGPRTPVTGQRVPEWQSREWRSFDTRNVQTVAKLNHLATMLSSPTEPPRPSDHPLAPTMLEIASKYSPVVPIGHSRRREYDESLATRDFDERIAGKSLEFWADRPGGITDVRGTGGLVERMALELHRARRFYERPESQGDYQERPTREHQPLPNHEPEFHERVTACGDHPALMRRLGLVIDLRADTDRLSRARFLTGRIIVPVDTEAGLATRMRVEQTEDKALVTFSEESDWQQGALTLGDEKRFTVLDIDADGSAIKTERFLWTIPRLAKIQDNDDPVDAATPALRAAGLTVARTGQALGTKRRIDRQTALQSEVATGAESVLTTEDVTRGMRVEVWDDTAGRWHSLHTRRTDVAVRGDVVLDDLLEEGWIQGTAAHETPGETDSAVHVHEAMFGWEGWSLSAPRPGKRIRSARPGEALPEGSARTGEVVEDSQGAAPGQKPPHPVEFTNRVEPGTLPRLRFGRSYAFRAWQVDLAGNSRPHELNPQPLPPLDDVTSALQATLPQGPRDSGAVWSRTFRQVATDALRKRMTDLVVEPATTAEELPAELAELVGNRLRELRTGVRGALLGNALRSQRLGTRRALVEAAVVEALGDDSQPLLLDTAVTAPTSLARLARSQLASRITRGSVAEQAGAALATVTKLQPFLRWDPVQPPSIVPRRRFTEGESNRVLVIRSGVSQDRTTGAITVTEPAAYAQQVRNNHPHLHYTNTSERHLAPPKTTQMTAELHGMFDSAMGPGHPGAIKKMLGWAIAEEGTWNDVRRPDLDNPPAFLPQPGISLQTSADVPQAEPQTLPLDPGQPAAPGQYVVHDVDAVTLPYLPDPMARGVSFLFPEAGLDRTIPMPFGGEGFTAEYGGSWPAKQPWRLVLHAGPSLGGRAEKRRIELRLPPGDVQKVKLSSSVRKADLELFGTWRSLPPGVQADPNTQEAAADGWLWGLTPSEDLMLVHAVPRPLAAPRPTRLTAFRGKGDTGAVLLGGVDVHGPSTDNLAAEATWNDPDDSITLPRWQNRPSSVVAFQTQVGPVEDLLTLGVDDRTFDVPGFGPVTQHRARHELGDTRHRLIDYTFRATTRFREYFHPSLLEPAFPGDDGRSVVARPVVVDVPSSAPPAAPVVHSVIPLFRWDYGTEGEQPMARRHVRRSGVRIYLERPWFSSGEGELLAVLLAAPGTGDDFDPRPDDESGYPFVSKIGQDPLWNSSPVEKRPLLLLQLDNLVHFAFPSDPPVPGRPVRQPVVLPLALGPGQPNVQVVGYQPQFSEKRNLWYVDVAIDPATAFWPFVRLAVARYQPSSVNGCHLSAPVRCDFAQLAPERTVSVSRTDTSHVRVVVSGPVGVRDPQVVFTRGWPPATVDQNRVVVARLQKRDPLISTDLGWQTVTASRLTIRGTGRNSADAAWVGELAAGEDLLLRRPLDPAAAHVPVEVGDPPSTWRVTVEEWERLPGDVPAPAEAAGPFAAAVPRWEQRLVFADEVLL